MIGPIDRDRRRQATVAFLGCWAAFLAYSFLRVPVPGINEPHYLGMAKADWNPSWCAGDLFLGSSKPHRAFYLLVGWMTTFLSLEQTAIVGRFAALAIAAWGWSKLCRSLGLAIAGTLLATSLFLLIQSTGSWSGEWLIGGVESKVFSYGFVFAGWAALIQQRSNAGALWLGLATTLHPVVGMWAAVATLCALIWIWWRDAGAAAQSETSLPRVPFRLTAGLWWFVAAAPGIGWALPALRSADAATSQLADYIQVSYRLAHHLDPWVFSKGGHLIFGGLVVAWLLLSAWGRVSESEGFRLLDAIAGASVLFGLGAMALSYGPRPLTFPQSTWGLLQLKLLKFYPFRLADLMSALMVAVTVSRLWTHRVTWSRGSLTSVVAAGFLTAAIAIPGPDKTPGNLGGARRSDWITTLRWLRDNAPPEALLYAANEDFAVKWFSNRPEYVNFKDCPQDAGGVMEWNSRLLKISVWSQESAAGDPSVSEDELHELGRRTGITHLIVSRFGAIEAKPVFERGAFRVFDLRGEAGPDK